MKKCLLCGKVFDDDRIEICPNCHVSLEMVSTQADTFSRINNIQNYPSYQQYSHTDFSSFSRIYCPNCQIQIPPGTNVCPNCGFFIQSSGQNFEQNNPKSSEQTTADSANLFCPKCGAPLYEGEEKCQKCGQKIGKLHQKMVKEEISKSANIPSCEKRKISIIRLILCLFLAGIILYESFNAAENIMKGGEGIMKIESVGGRTLEEAYYFELGYIYNGWATVVRMLGLFMAGVLTILGLEKQ